MAEKTGAAFAVLVGEKERDAGIVDRQDAARRGLRSRCRALGLAARSARVCKIRHHVRSRTHPRRNASQDRRRKDRSPPGMGEPPPRPRRARLHRPARPIGHRAGGLRRPVPPGRRSPRPSQGASQRVRPRRDGHGRRARRVEPSTASFRPARSRCARRTRHPESGRHPALPDRRRHQGVGRPAPHVPLSRPPAPRDDEEVHDAERCDDGDPRGDARGGLPRRGDADPHEVDARGRTRLSRPVARSPGRVLRPPAVAAALQAAPDGVGDGALLPDRPLLPGRGPAGRPPARVHAGRHRDVVPERGGRLRAHREALHEGLSRVGDPVRRALPADDVRRGDGALRHRPAGHALRPRIGKPRRGLEENISFEGGESEGSVRARRRLVFPQAAGRHRKGREGERVSSGSSG